MDRIVRSILGDEMMQYIYLTGSWKNKATVKDLMNDIENWGHKIVVDWTLHNKSKGTEKDHVAEIIKGLQTCTCMVYCMDGIKSLGKNFELGYITALNKPIGIFLFNSYKENLFGPAKSSFDKIIGKEYMFIKSRMYPILYTVEELKNWLSNLINSMEIRTPLVIANN